MSLFEKGRRISLKTNAAYYALTKKLWDDSNAFHSYRDKFTYWLGVAKYAAEQYDRPASREAKAPANGKAGFGGERPADAGSAQSEADSWLALFSVAQKHMRNLLFLRDETGKLMRLSEEDGIYGILDFGLKSVTVPALGNLKLETYDPAASALEFFDTLSQRGNPGLGIWTDLEIVDVLGGAGMGYIQYAETEALIMARELCNPLADNLFLAMRFFNLGKDQSKGIFTNERFWELAEYTKTQLFDILTAGAEGLAAAADEKLASSDEFERKAGKGLLSRRDLAVVVMTRLSTPEERVAYDLTGTETSSR